MYHSRYILLKKDSPKLILVSTPLKFILLIKLFFGKILGKCS